MCTVPGGGGVCKGFLVMIISMSYAYTAVTRSERNKAGSSRQRGAGSCRIGQSLGTLAGTRTSQTAAASAADTGRYPTRGCSACRWAAAAVPWSRCGNRVRAASLQLRAHVVPRSPRLCSTRAAADALHEAEQGAKRVTSAVPRLEQRGKPADSALSGRFASWGAG